MNEENRTASPFGDTKKAVFETDHLSIFAWFNKIKNSNLVLPKFQRMEVWGPNQRRELLQSIVEGVPIGSLLLLKAGGGLEFSWKPISGAEAKEKAITEYLLDGQQRLTTLWRAFTADYQRDAFFVQVEPDESTDPEDLPLIIRRRRYTKEGSDDIYPLWTFDAEKIHERGLVPVEQLNPLNAAPGKQWVDKIADGDDEKKKQLVFEEELDDKINHLHGAMKNFEIPYIALGSETDGDMVLTTFTRVNEQGTKLSTFDLMVAKLAHHEVDLHDRVKQLWEEVPALDRYLEIDDLDILRAAVLLQGKKPTQTKILDIDAAYLNDLWNDLVIGAKKSLSFLEEEGIYDAQRLPTETVLPFLFALWAKDVPEGGLQEGEAKGALRKYLWYAFFSDHFEAGSTNTLITQDYKAMSSYLNGNGNLVEVPCFQAELPDDEKLVDAGWPKKKSRLARAILALTLREGAKDLYTGSPVNPNNVSGREYHHLFPRAYLEKHGGEEEANKSLNVALITLKTNREISANNPKQYLEKVQEAENMDKDVLKHRLQSHLIPYESFMKEDYFTFLFDRANLVRQKLEELVQVK